MNVPYRKTHKGTRCGAVPGCRACEAEQAALLRIASHPLSGPICSKCDTPVQNWPKHRGWCEQRFPFSVKRELLKEIRDLLRPMSAIAESTKG